MSKGEKWFWRGVFYTLLAFCTILFSYSLTGPWPKASALFLALSLMLLFVTHRI